MRFVLLDEGDGYHVYQRAPGKTLCGKAVRAFERGWADTGCSIEDPIFPLKLCSDCRALVPAETDPKKGPPPEGT